MATLREYFEGDFGHAIRVPAYIRFNDEELDVALFYDFSGFVSFLAIFVPANRDSQYLQDLLSELEFGATKITLPPKLQVRIPHAHLYPGELQVEAGNFCLRGRSFGDADWTDMRDLPSSTRIYLYADFQVTDTDAGRIKDAALARKKKLQIRTPSHAATRSSLENPLAFVCHDSRDKKEFAFKIALGLQKRMCPVWYDEFTMQVGDNLRDKIEKGLRECRKCIIVLSPNFLSNGGWSKKEFDSIFTREILEERGLILPVWCGVSKRDVFEYSPSLANVLALDWTIGEEEVCRRLHTAILSDFK